MNKQQRFNRYPQAMLNLWQEDLVSANDGYTETAMRPAAPSWQPSGEQFGDTTEKGVPTGFTDLDQALPWLGLPTKGLIEVICSQQDMGELQLLLPLLQQRSQGKQSLLWITPPYPLHSPTLAQSGINLKNSFVVPSQTQCNQALWSIEKALQSQECAMVLAWQNWLSARVLRRLELAAQHGNTLGVLFHQRPQAQSSSTLQLALNVTQLASGQRVLDVTVRQIKGRVKGSRHRLMLS